MVEKKRHTINSSQPLYSRVIAFTLAVLTLLTVFANEIPSLHTHDLLNENHCESLANDEPAEPILEESPELCPFFVWNSNSSNIAVSFEITEHIQTTYQLYFAAFNELCACTVADAYSSRAPPIPFC